MFLEGHRSYVRLASAVIRVSFRLITSLCFEPALIPEKTAGLVNETSFILHQIRCLPAQLEQGDIYLASRRSDKVLTTIHLHVEE